MQQREREGEKEGDIHLLQVPYSWKLFFCGFKIFPGLIKIKVSIMHISCNSFFVNHEN